MTSSAVIMAYRIPLRNCRHRGHVTGWSKLMHIAPLFLRSPAVTKGPWTVEIVTFSCILVTLGGVCLVWTAANPEYGSYLVGGALVTLGACWIGIICALRWNHEETRAAAMAAAQEEAHAPGASTSSGHRGSTAGVESDVDEETTMIHVDVDSSHTSPSAVSVIGDARSSATTDFRSTPDFRSPDFRVADFRSDHTQPPSSIFRPDAPDMTSFPSNRDVTNGNDDVRGSPEGAVENPHVNDFR